MVSCKCLKYGSPDISTKAKNKLHHIISDRTPCITPDELVNMYHNIPNAEKAIEQALNVHPIIPYCCNHDDVSVTPRKCS